MRKTVPLLVVAAFAMFTDRSEAASPGYCALYAREYATARIARADDSSLLGARQRLEDQAFTHCLNLDVEPDFPATSVYYGSSAEDLVGVVAEGDASYGDETLIDPAPAPAPKPKPKVVASNAGLSRGKLAQGSDAWRDWCSDHYPNSWDESTGTVLPLGNTKRETCRP